MKKIENKELDLKLDDGSSLKYANLLLTIVTKQPTSQITVAQMQLDFELEDIIRPVVEGDLAEFEVSPEQLAYLKSQVARSEWPMRSREIVKFVHEFSKL